MAQAGARGVTIAVPEPAGARQPVVDPPSFRQALKNSR
jgi:hypothetical protein